MFDKVLTLLSPNPTKWSNTPKQFVADELFEWFSSICEVDA